MSFFGGGASSIDELIPDSYLFKFEDLTNTYLIDTDGGSPKIVMKLRLDFPSSMNGSTPLIVWSANQFNVHKIVNLHSSVYQWQYSADDATYFDIYNTQAGFNADGLQEDLRMNLSLTEILTSKLFLRLAASINTAGVESVELSKIKWQMLLLYAKGATVTRLV